MTPYIEAVIFLLGVLALAILLGGLALLIYLVGHL